MALLGILGLGAFACDDSAPGSGGRDSATDDGVGGGGAGGDDGGGGGGVGGGSNEICVGDDDCPTTEYCDRAPGAFDGLCRTGCRADSCGPGQVCGPDRTCLTPGCEGDDTACGAGQYCDPETDACTDGCRIGAACPLIEGRNAICNADRECEALFPCCDAGNACTEQTEAACGAASGRLLAASLSCEGNPCDATTCAGDGDCSATEYCNGDGVCADGCRANEICPDANLTCDAETRTCLQVACDPSAPGACQQWQFCDPATNLCREADCREDGDCEGGQICRTGRCVTQCDPNLPDVCGEGGICRPDSLICDDICTPETDNCEANQACNLNTGLCEVGRCRDDIYEPNDTLAQATPIPLVAAGVGIRQGRLDNLILCPDNLLDGQTQPQDFYAITLAQGERLQITLTNPGVGDANLDIELLGDEVEGVVASATLNDFERLEYPPANDAIRNATTYYLRVHGDIDELANYGITVVVVEGENPCFPDPREPGDNTRAGATRLVRDQERFLGTICVGDEDWFQTPFEIDDGFTVEVSTPVGSAPLDLRLYNAATLDGPGGLAAPSFRVNQGVVVGGRVVYRLTVAENTNALSTDTWYFRLVSPQIDGFADYEFNLTVVRVNDPCLPDAREPNNDFASAVQLDAFPGISAGGQVIAGVEHVVDDALTICPGDTDWFCLTAEEGNVLEAWVVGEALLGSISVRFVNQAGGNVGSVGAGTAPGAPRDAARVPGVAAGRYCAVVSGQARAEGAYTLSIRRNAVAVNDQCLQDVAETAPGTGRRNDTASTATALEDVGEVAGQRFVYEEGLLCNLGGTPDLDWYTFPVAQAESRICVTVDGFSDARADIDLQVFRAAAGEAGDACQNDGQCGVGGACIQNRCRPFVQASVTEFDAEMVDLTRGVVGDRIGPHYVKVFRGAPGGTEPYRVQATVTPTHPQNACAEDWQEIGRPNNNTASATFLGSGQVALCDTWLCATERNTGDWYELIIPRGEDRTVLIEHQRGTDGALALGLFADLADDGSNMPRPANIRSVSDYQCLNIEGSADADRIVFVSVTGNVNPGVPRNDYSLRVVPTDVSVRPVGECLSLGAINLDPCNPADLASDSYRATGCWPTFSLE